MNQYKTRPLHQCACETCQHYPRSETVKEHRAINRLLATLDEKSRRRFAGLLVITAKHGGIQRLIEITGDQRQLKFFSCCLSRKCYRRKMRLITRSLLKKSQ